MTDRVLVALAPGPRCEAACALAALPGAEVVVAGPAAAHDCDVVIAAFEDLEAVVTAIGDAEPSPVIVAVARNTDLDAAGASAAIFATIPEDRLGSWLPAALGRALHHGELQRRSRHAHELEALLAATDPERLPSAIAETAQRLLAADAVVVFTRGRDGKLQPGPTARPRAGAPVNVPLEALLRRSVRKARDAVAEPFVEPLSELWAVGLVLTAGHAGQGVAPPPHGVLWALKSMERREFQERDLSALGAIGRTACLALDHLRVVRDLQHRLAAMGHTRRQMEEDARAAHVGRVAVDALRALQSPLAYMRTNLRFLSASDEMPTAGNAAKHLQYTLDGLTRAEHLLEDAARVSEGRGRVPIEVRQLLDAVLALARPIGVPEYVEIEHNSVVLGNASKLSQAIAEVVRNASQAEGATRIDVRASRLGDEVLIEVVDDGEGIADDLLPRVREPFFSTRGRAGLGLTSAGEAIEAGGGTLQIWSRPGIGTTVQILLPSQILDEEDAIALGDGPGLDFGEE